MRHYYGYVPIISGNDIDSDISEFVSTTRKLRCIPQGSLIISNDLRYLRESEDERDNGKFCQRISRIKAESIYGRAALEKMIDFADNGEEG